MAQAKMETSGEWDVVESIAPLEQPYIVENIYNCWEREPLNTGSVEISTKKGPVEIKLSDINIPEKYVLGYHVSLGQTVNYLRFYEEMDLDPEISERSMLLLADLGAGLLTSAIRRIKVLKESAPFPDIQSNDSYFRQKYKDDFEGWEDEFEEDTYQAWTWDIMRLEEAFPEFSEDTLSELLDKVRLQVETYIQDNFSDPSDSKERATLEEILNVDVSSMLRSSSRPLIPEPAIFCDDMISSRFYRGKLPGGFIVGNIPSNYLEGDLDASAALRLRRYINRYTEKKLENSKTFAPPNMTNAFVINIPAAPRNDIANKDRLGVSRDDEIHGNEGALFFPMILCEDPTRLNPNIVYAELDYRYGKGGYILATTDPETGKLVRIEALPKEQWKIGSRPKRPAMLLP